MDGNLESEWSEEKEHEKIFYECIRQYIISLLVFIGLYSVSYNIIRQYKKKKDQESDHDHEDDLVYRISFWLCCFTSTISIGAVLLLPLSIISNEVLLLYPNSHYMKWLNDSLIHSLWNQIFLGTYLALFLAMPFAYFFTESEGFAGSTKGIRAKIVETFVVLLLLGILVASLVWVVYGIFIGGESTDDIDSWLPRLPLIYSYISLFGVLLQLVCTPLGVTRLFTVLGEIVVKPQFLRDIDDEIFATEFEEENIRRKMNVIKTNGFLTTHVPANKDTNTDNKLLELQERKKKLERERDASAWERNLLYPVCLLMFLTLTAACLCMVAMNCLSLLFMKGKLPFKTRNSSLGKMSFSMLGSFGSMIEVILIFYIMCASIVGFYGMHVFQHLRPKRNKTSMVKLIANCIIMLVLSSALPVLTRILGITNFDLMGEFGRLDWLKNFQLVLFYNLLFEASTALCLTRKFTASVRQAILDQMKQSPIYRKLSRIKQKTL